MMNGSQGRLLVVGHEASRSGAPLLLLDLLRWMRASGDFPPLQIVLQRGGALLAEYKEVAPVHVLQRIDPARSRLSRFLSRRIVDRRMALRIRLRRVIAELRPTRSDRWYVNTAVLGWLLPELGAARADVVVHVHERGDSIRRFATTRDAASLFSCAERFIAVSDTVRRDLLSMGAEAPESIRVVRNWIPERSESRQPREMARRELREELGLPPGAWIVGSVGNIDAVKGPDLWVDVARRFLELTGARQFAFAWVGDSRDASFLALLRRKIDEAGLAAHVRFCGGRSDPREFIAGCDAMTISSRSEGSSLVLLEAADAGIPAVVFAGSGGPAEFAAGGCAGLVPGFDTDLMAACLAEWRENPRIASQVAERARAKLTSEHDRESQCRKIAEHIRGGSGSGPRPT